MGKTSSWLRSFLIAKREKKETYPSDRKSSILIPQPTSKERRRWSFRRSSASSKDKNSNPNQSNVGQLSASQIDKPKNTPTNEDGAATRIQSAFRSHLARKALLALRGLVKLQALVRGHLVRKRATATLRCMQALMTAQARARAQRLRMADDSKSSTPRHFFQGKYYRYEKERGMEENIKIVEVDLGHGANQHKERTQGYFDGYYSSSTTAQSSPKLHSPAPARHDHSKPCSNFGVESQATHDNPFYPNYMANTESSRAKARSQSAPKTRPPDWLESRRWASLEGWHCPGPRPRPRPRPVRSMQRSSSQAGFGAQNSENPWGIKLDKSCVSLKDSDCGSTSTVPSSTNYCRSLAAYATRGNPSPC